MLAASEFSVGTIGEAAPLTLILPRREYEPIALIGCAAGDESPAVFFLDDRNMFKWFKCAENQHWSGIQIPGVQIEVDETSVFDPDHNWPKPGCVVRQSTQLVAVAESSSFYSSRGTEAVVLVEDLAPSSQRAAFSRWQISLGRDALKRILHIVDADK